MTEILTEASYPLETQPDEQIKNSLLNTSYLASPEEKTEVDFLEASYPASPVEKIEADLLNAPYPVETRPEVRIKGEPQNTIDKRSTRDRDVTRSRRAKHLLWDARRRWQRMAQALRNCSHCQ